MTNKLLDVMIFILKSYPDRLASEMSNARFTKMVYLSDWKNAIDNGEQITDIEWYFDNYGPFVSDVEKTAKSRPDIFKIVIGTNMYGQPKKTFQLQNEQVHVDLSDAEKHSISAVSDETKKLYWNEFIKLVYSTHPVASAERYSYLNLTEMAKDYNQIKTSRLEA